MFLCGVFYKCPLEPVDRWCCWIIEFYVLESVGFCFMPVWKYFELLFLQIFFFHSCPLSPFCQGLKRHTYHIFFLITDLGGSIHFYLFSLYSDWVISVVLSSKFIDSSTPFILKFMSIHSYFDIYLNDKYLSSEIQETKPVTGHGGGSFPRTTEEFCLGEKLFSLMKYPIVLFFTLPMLHWLI